MVSSHGFHMVVGVSFWEDSGDSGVSGVTTAGQRDAAASKVGECAWGEVFEVDCTDNCSSPCASCFLSVEGAR